MGRSIGQVSAELEMSPAALRWYEDEGLLIRPVARDATSRRVFSDADVAWLRTCRALRQTGMGIDGIRRYVELARLGPESVDDRLALLQAHVDRVREQVSSLMKNLALIEGKAAAYANRIATDGREHADASWETTGHP